MTTKNRLERVLQILEDVERVGTISDIERDIVLNELREAYQEVRFADVASLKASVEPSVADTPVPPVAPVVEADEESSEPEVEVELIFDEGDEDDEVAEQTEETTEETTVEESVVVEPEPAVEPEPVVEPESVVELEPVVEEPVVEEPAVVEPELQILAPKAPQRSAILSLYDDEPQLVLGEQFASEQPSVADTIAPLKGVADVARVESLRSSIGVVDRFMLIRELFDGDSEAYNAAIDALDALPTFDDCLIYIAEHFSWRAEREGTRFMMDLLQRKFH